MDHKAGPDEELGIDLIYGFPFGHEVVGRVNVRRVMYAQAHTGTIGVVAVWDSEGLPVLEGVVRGPRALVLGQW